MGSANTQTSDRDQCLQNCTSPEQVFSIAASLAVFFWCRLSTLEVQTLINLLELLITNLSTLVIQQQLCQGISVTPGDTAT